MIKINLMPWREEEYERQKKQFYLLLGLVFLCAVFLAGFFHLYYQQRLSSQHIRNQYLAKEWSFYEVQIRDFKQLKREQQVLLERMNLIQALQAERLISVALFSEFVKLIPNGVYIESIARAGNAVMITGRAKHYEDIAELIRNFERSRFFTETHLKKIASQTQLFRESFLINLKIKQEG